MHCSLILIACSSTRGLRRSKTKSSSLSCSAAEESSSFSNCSLSSSCSNCAASSAPSTSILVAVSISPAVCNGAGQPHVLRLVFLVLFACGAASPFFFLHFPFPFSTWFSPKVLRPPESRKPKRCGPDICPAQDCACGGEGKRRQTNPSEEAHKQATKEG